MGDLRRERIAIFTELTVFKIYVRRNTTVQTQHFKGQLVILFKGFKGEVSLYLIKKNSSLMFS